MQFNARKTPSEHCVALLHIFSSQRVHQGKTIEEMKFSDHVEVNIDLVSRHARKQAALATWRFALASTLAKSEAGTGSASQPQP